MGQPDNIQSTENMYLPIWHWILHSDAIGFGRLPFYKQIQWIQYYGKWSRPLPFLFWPNSQTMDQLDSPDQNEY